MIEIDELKKLKAGEVYDVTIIDADEPYGDTAQHPGKTFRFVFERLNVELDPEARRQDGGPKKMTNPITTVAWGAAVIQDLPEHIFIPKRVRETFDPAFRYGFHQFLIKSIDLVEEGDPDEVPE